MKIRFYLLALIIVLTSSLYSQFDKPVLQLGIGLVEPFDDLKGTFSLLDEKDFYGKGINLEQQKQLIKRLRRPPTSPF